MRPSALALASVELMKKFDADAVQQLMARLEELPERRTLRPYDLIAQIEGQLSRVQGRGYDLDDLMAVLHEFGLELARSTVRNYLSRVRATHRKKPAPSEVTAFPRPPGPPRHSSVVLIEPAPSASPPRTETSSAPNPHPDLAPESAVATSAPRGRFEPKPDSDEI